MLVDSSTKTLQKFFGNVNRVFYMSIYIYISHIYLIYISYRYIVWVLWCFFFIHLWNMDCRKWDIDFTLEPPRDLFKGECYTNSIEFSCCSTSNMFHVRQATWTWQFVGIAGRKLHHSWPETPPWISNGVYFQLAMLPFMSPKFFCFPENCKSWSLIIYHPLLSHIFPKMAGSIIRYAKKHVFSESCCPVWKISWNFPTCFPVFLILCWPISIFTGLEYKSNAFLKHSNSRQLRCRL